MDRSLSTEDSFYSTQHDAWSPATMVGRGLTLFPVAAEVMTCIHFRQYRLNSIVPEVLAAGRDEQDI